MERLPFDPGKVRGSKPAVVSDPQSRPLSVCQLAALIESTLRDAMPLKLRVRGEMSGLKQQTHWYFTLKDPHAVINCVMFASAARKINAVPRNGEEVVATGRIEFWGKGGRIQFYIDTLEAVGQGTLEQRYQLLVEELRTLGWFGIERKRRLPGFPRRVAVVTSRSGAALQDVIDTARRRCPAVELYLVDVRVQGESASSQVAGAIDWLSAHHGRLGIDAVILTRGGGSLEDLWAFNDRDVARSIVECRVPVVAAIGHETDTTIAELVADERCATPTQAVMRLLPDASLLREQILLLGRRLDARLQRLLGEERRYIASVNRRPGLLDPLFAISRRKQHLHHTQKRLLHLGDAITARKFKRVQSLSERLNRHRPERQLGDRERRLDRIGFRLHAAMHDRLRRCDHQERFDALHNAVARQFERLSDRTAALARELEVASPLRILARGYTVTTDAKGRVLRSAADAMGAGELFTRFSDGTVRTIHPGTPRQRQDPEAIGPNSGQHITEDPAREPAVPPRSGAKMIPRRRNRTAMPGGPSDQMGLFGH